MRSRAAPAGYRAEEPSDRSHLIRGGSPMHADRRFALGVLVAVAIAAGVPGFSRDVRSAHAQAAGDTYLLLVPAGTGVAIGATGDKVIFIGRFAGNVGV